MRPVSVEVITLAPTVFTHCQHCELTFGEIGIGERLRREQAAQGLPDDLAREYQALSDWVHGVLERFGPAVSIKVIDAASIQGFVLAIRHRIARSTGVIVDGRRIKPDEDYGALTTLIARRVADAGEPAASRTPAQDEGPTGTRKEVIRSQR